ncbi:nidogen-like domain-containing protein [Nocardioides solisilvae]|uniref:nidogen-like domain-containing protein n=1 Tax=Nocardioides solisilvae TaxID=1542435 RepID=UPI000D744DB9|nr:nidogen-like domain-containing protein [Nocardioides solisilvae]
MRRVVLLAVALVVSMAGLAVTSSAHAAPPKDQPDPKAVAQAEGDPGTVEGAVAYPEDGPETWGYVSLYGWNADFDYFDYVDEAEVSTSSPGYAFTGVAPGTYYLRYDDYDDLYFPAWSQGATQSPSDPDQPGAFVVSSDQTVGTQLVPMPRNGGPVGGPAVTGTLTGVGGARLADAQVTAYAWDGSAFGPVAADMTEDDGSFRLVTPTGQQVTLGFEKRAYVPVFLGGGASLPAAPDAGNTVTVTEDDVAVGTVAMTSRPSTIGRVAGQAHDWCRTSTVPSNDDGSSAGIPVPFDMTFFGTPHDTLFVNNNGNVTFGSGLSDYTPSDLTGPTELPIIAPFFADVDTRGTNSWEVSYGTSPDGTKFCVNWADVGYYSYADDKLNTFQLILSSTENDPGRSEGDFDITFNYDRVLWETGEASDGVDGFGGTSAAVGFSGGTGQPGTFVQLAGSFVNGALLDGGANALVAGSQGATQPGRYVFPVRNEGLETLYGGLDGSVQTEDAEPVADAYVQVCVEAGNQCSYTHTTPQGAFSFPARPAGDQVVRVWPPSGDLFAGGGTATVAVGETTTMEPIVLAAPRGMPDNATLGGSTGTGDVPSVYYGDPLPLTVRGCAGVDSPTYTVLLEGRVVRGPLPLTEGPAGSYSAMIAPLYPLTGSAEIRTNVPGTCGGAETRFNVYIDPSGTVTDQWGRPVAEAIVTLLRSDTYNGDYTVVPDGSDVMSPSNRANPDTTDDAGFFRWDVTAGWYKVRVDANGCTSTTTDGMEVPPEKIDLLIRMQCSSAAPAPTTAPSVTGDPVVGSTITAAPGTWAEPLVEAGVELLRNGIPMASATHTLTAGDVGAVFTARSGAQRPDYVDVGQALTVTFTRATATSAPVTGRAAPSAQPTPGPSESPSPSPQPTAGPTPAPEQPVAEPVVASRTLLKVDRKKSTAKKTVVVVTLEVAAGGSTAGTVQLKAGKKVLATRTVAAGTTKVTFKLSAKKLEKLKGKAKGKGKKGKKRAKAKKAKVSVKAQFGGNAQTAGSVSRAVKL